MKNAALIFFLITLLFACKDPEPEDKCSNGFLDPGEESIDCGGVCEDCPPKLVPACFATINGVDVSFNDLGLQQDNGQWYLNVSNDSIQLFLIHTSDGSVGQYPFDPLSQVTYNGANYELYTEDAIQIGENNTTSNYMSGSFSAKFYRSAGDTLTVFSGVFQDLAY